MRMFLFKMFTLQNYFAGVNFEQQQKLRGGLQGSLELGKNPSCATDQLCDFEVA